MKSSSNHDLYLHLVLLSVRAKKHLSVYCESKQLTPVQGIVLLLLDPKETKTMHELSEMMGCDASNITGLVDRLEANDLICRYACKKDRRIKELSLTKKGATCRADIIAQLDRSQTADLEKLTEDEKAQLIQLTRKVIT